MSSVELTCAKPNRWRGAGSNSVHPGLIRRRHAKSCHQNCFSENFRENLGSAPRFPGPMLRIEAGRQQDADSISGIRLGSRMARCFAGSNPSSFLYILPMSAPLIAALVFTVALLVTTAYFLFGSVPLLVLSHDTPLDSRFVRGFFNAYYLAAMCTAGAAALCYMLAGRIVFGAGAAALALLAVVLRWKLMPLMDSLRAQMVLVGAEAVPEFRRMHLSAIFINLVQLVVIVWSLMAFSAQLI